MSTELKVKPKEGWTNIFVKDKSEKPPEVLEAVPFI